MFLVKDFKGFTTFEKAMFGTFIASQIAIILYFILFGSAEDRAANANWIYIVASISGLLCVIMSAKGRLSTFFYGLIQVVTYGWISYQHGYFGEVGLQVVFGLFQFIGLYFWIKNMHTDQLTDDPFVKEVDSKGLNGKELIVTIIVTAIIYYIVGTILEYKLHAKQPWIDAVATSLSLVGQTLMTLRYKEQWFFWIVINMVSIFLWARGMVLNGGVSFGEVMMAVMWVAFLINSVYGYYNWKKLQQAALEQRNY